MVFVGCGEALQHVIRCLFVETLIPTNWPRATAATVVIGVLSARCSVEAEEYFKLMACGHFHQPVKVLAGAAVGRLIVQYPVANRHPEQFHS